MRGTLLPAVAALTLVAAVALLKVERAAQEPPAATDSEAMPRLPVAFVPNAGQWRHPARYVARVGPMTVFLAANGWTFTREEQSEDERKARGVAVRMTFVGARDARLVPERRLPGRHNYFLGNDPSRWRSDVPLYAAVRYRGVHPGIDVCAREQDGRFEYDLLLEPGADLAAIEIEVEGIERMRVDPDGALALETALGPVRMPAPRTWEEGPSGEKSPIACRYVLRGADRFGFEVPGRRPGWALVVDPGLVWSTYLGGASRDVPEAVAVDGQGATTVAGWTESANYPTTSGAYDSTFNGPGDAFVTKLTPSGKSLSWSTFLGGTGSDGAAALALDSQGRAIVAGGTSSKDFPTTDGAYDRTLNAGGDAFVARLSASGSKLVYSTFLGGTGGDVAKAVAVDASGAATLTGYTASPKFPTTQGAFDRTLDGPVDAFVTRLAPDGASLLYSTYLGGSGAEQSVAIAVDAKGSATVAGWVASSDFPRTKGAFDTTYNGSYDAFVARLAPSGSLVWSTYLGGKQNDWAFGLAVDAQGMTTVVGRTWSTDFPSTAGAFDTTHNGNVDAFVTRLSPKGTSLDYSTFIGGIGAEEAFAVAVDTRGAATVVGAQSGRGFPTTPGAYDRTPNGWWDAFAARLSPSGSDLVYSTLVGGTGDRSWALGVALDAQGGATMVGRTKALDFPTTSGAYDRSHNGGYGDWDAFATRLDMLPTGVAAFGLSSPGCTGPLAISVTSMPSIGNAGFGFTCSNAPPNGGGGLALSGARLQKALPILGVGSWVDLTSPAFLVVPVTSDGVGAADLPMPLPPDPKLVGVRFYAQFFWVGPTSPRPCPPLGVSASHALDVTIHPAVAAP